MSESPEKPPNPYPGVYPACTQCSGRGKVIHQGSLNEVDCEKCKGLGYIVDPYTASTAPRESGG